MSVSLQQNKVHDYWTVMSEGTLGSQRGRALRRLASHGRSACDIFFR